MTQSLKQIKSRIRSIENTKKVTNAMQMVSASKLHRLGRVHDGMKTYFLKLESMLADLLNSGVPVTHPLVTPRQPVTNIALCVITSDSGLCGMYNQDALAAAEDFIDRQGRGRVGVIAVGKKGFTYFKKRGIPVLHAYLKLNGRYHPEVAEEIAGTLVNLYASGETDEVYSTYTHLKRALLRGMAVEKILPVSLAGAETDSYITEPDAAGVLDELVPKYLSFEIRRILIESFMAEQAARMIAMKSATDNADELLRWLVLSKNKLRQAIITREIMEIIASAEALKE